VQWRVPRQLPLLKAAAAAVFLLVGLLAAADPVRLAVALGAAAVLAGFALRDVVAPVRLAADGSGVTVVRGFAGRHRIPWSDVERVRVDVRRRLGLRSELLEIDVGSTLHLFSAYDLGAPPEQVAGELVALRTGRR